MTRQAGAQHDRQRSVVPDALAQDESLAGLQDEALRLFYDDTHPEEIGD